MKYTILLVLITVVALGAACGQAPEPVANDGIQVHGHWTVTVTNPDGTVDAVREFDNTLAGYGSDLLTTLLAGEAAILLWEIIIYQDGNTSIDNALVCQENPGGTLGARAAVPAVASRNTSVDGAPLMLSANCTVQTAESSLNLDEVMTLFALDTLVEMVAQQGGTDIVKNIYLGYFTSHSFPAISVINDQMLSFNVEVTFS